MKGGQGLCQLRDKEVCSREELFLPTQRLGKAQEPQRQQVPPTAVSGDLFSALPLETAPKSPEGFQTQGGAEGRKGGGSNSAGTFSVKFRGGCVCLLALWLQHRPLCTWFSSTSCGAPPLCKCSGGLYGLLSSVSPSDPPWKRPGRRCAALQAQ